jgi:CheY-like chemotaxis protein
MLLRLHGYKVKAMPCAEDALAWLQQEGHLNIIAIVDVNLPGMSGVEFVRRARRIFSDMPCVFMSANDEVNLEQIRQAFRQPALRKPFELRSLLGLIAGSQHVG